MLPVVIADLNLARPRTAHVCSYPAFLAMRFCRADSATSAQEGARAVDQHAADALTQLNIA
jgi:hypothetical protein